MTDHQSRHSSYDDLFGDDPLAIIVLPIAVLLIVGGSLPIWVDGATAWLIEHQILVAKAAHPVLTIPWTNGAGLDVRRIVVAIAVVTAVSGGSYGAIRRRLRRES